MYLKMIKLAAGVIVASITIIENTINLGKMVKEDRDKKKEDEVEE